MTKMVLKLGYSKPAVRPSSSHVSVCWNNSLICTGAFILPLTLLPFELLSSILWHMMQFICQTLSSFCLTKGHLRTKKQAHKNIKWAHCPFKKRVSDESHSGHSYLLVQCYSIMESDQQTGMSGHPELLFNLWIIIMHIIITLPLKFSSFYIFSCMFLLNFC